MKTLLVTSLGLVLLVGAARAADPVVRARTGDRTFDTSLRQMDSQAGGDMAGFVRMLSARHQIPEDQIRAAQQAHALSPSDLYMATGIAHMTHRPVLTVAETYSRDRGRGWGAIAKDMGIKPGSRQFHDLKDGARGSLDQMRSEARGRQKHEQKQEKDRQKWHGEGRGKK